MLIALLGIVTILLMLNMAFYEYRVLKPFKKDKDVFNAWVRLQLRRKYKI